MYNEYFGLADTPFRLTPDTRLFYPGGGRGEVLDALIYAVTSGEGIIKVVGEVGTGKTMLCRMLEERLPDTVEVVYLANPSLTPEDILHAIALELGLEMQASASRIQIMHRLQQALLERHGRNCRVVALVEEAQSMPLDTLEEIRLLSNLETKSEKLLQIVLFGQPELDENLAVPQIRQLRERITHGFTLQTLSSEEIRNYMEFRLRASGYRGREAFSNKAYKVMFKASEGLTRRVNILADKSLLAAFAEDTHDVSERHVKVAVQDTQLSVPARRGSYSPLLRAGGFVLAMAIGWLAAAWYLSNDSLIALEPPTASIATPQHQGGSETVSAPVTGKTPAPVPVAAQVATAPPSITQPQVDARVHAGSGKLAPPARGDIAKIENPPSVPAGDTPDRIDIGTSGSVSAPVAGSATPTRPQKATMQVDAVEIQPAAPPPAQNEPVQVLLTAPEPQVAEANSVEPVPSVHTTQQAPMSELQPLPAPAVVQPASPVANTASLSSTSSQDQTDVATSTPAATVVFQPVVPTAESAKAEPLGVLEQRLERTRDWLRQVNPRHFSIQVLATDARQRRNLISFLKRRVRNGLTQNLYVYETQINKRPWYGVLYGEFDEYSKARQALQELPQSMQRQQPFIRNISDITAIM